jgi:hypothetical protein
MRGPFFHLLTIAFSVVCLVLPALSNGRSNTPPPPEIRGLLHGWVAEPEIYGGTLFGKNLQGVTAIR